MSFSPQGKAEVNTKAFCIPRRRLSQMCRVVLVHHMALWCPHTTWHRHVHTLHGTATWNYSAPTQHNQFSSHNNRVRKKNKFYSILRKPLISHSQFDYFMLSLFSAEVVACITLVLSASLLFCLQKEIQEQRSGKLQHWPWPRLASTVSW